MSYISSFISTLPKTQRQAIKAILSSESYRKNIPTLAELLKNIDELSANINLNTENSIPLSRSLPSGLANGSKGINDVSKYFSYDLQSIYTEVDNIALLFEEVSRLIELEKKNIEKKLNALDNDLTKIEIINDYYQDLYSTVVYNSFNGINSSSLGFGDNKAKYLYTDPRTRVVYDARDVLFVDFDKEGVLLPLERIRKINIKDVYVSSGSNTTESDVKYTVTHQDSFSTTPLNTVDRLKYDDDSVWMHSVFVNKTASKLTPPSNTTCELIVDLGGLQSINFCRLSMGTPFSLQIDSLMYEAADGEIYTIINEPFTLTKAINLTFNRVLASKLYIQLRQSNYLSVDSGIVLGTDENTLTDINIDFTSTQPTYNKSLLDEIKALPNVQSKSLNGWLYTFSLDKLDVGYGAYKKSGVFVSQPIKISSTPDRIAIDSTLIKSVDANSNVGEAVEFYCYVFEYDENNHLINREVLPIYSLSDTNVEHELIHLNVSGIGKLRFFPDVEEDITIYRDFTPLTVGTDYTISVDKGTTYESTTTYSASPSGPPYEYNIAISSISPTSIYTATYTPKKLEISSNYPIYVGSSTIGVLNSDGSIKLFYPESRSKYIDRSEIFLTCIFRSLNSNVSFRSTAILIDYTVFIK